MQRRPGRKRKEGKRYQSGDLKRREGVGELGIVRQRLRRQASDGAPPDPRLLTQLWRIHENGELSQVEAIAGFRILETYVKYENATNFTRKAPSLSYEALAGSEVFQSTHDEDRQNGIREFNELQEHMASLPKETRNAVEELCVEDKFPGAPHYPEIREFLRHLAREWNIVPVPPLRTRRKPGRPFREIVMESHMEEKAAELDRNEQLEMEEDGAKEKALIEMGRLLRPDMTESQLAQLAREFSELARAMEDRDKYVSERDGNKRRGVISLRQDQ